MYEAYGLFIDGRWRHARDRATLPVVDPATEELTQLTAGDHALRAWSYQPQLDAHVVSVSTCRPSAPFQVMAFCFGRKYSSA